MDRSDHLESQPTPPNPHRPFWLGLVVALLAVIAFATIAPRLLPAFFHTSPAATAKAAPKYHCPMHPSVVSDKPGSCPICGMDLVPIGEGGPNKTDHLQSGVAGLAVVSISPQARQTMGLKLGTVEKQPVAREVRTSARITADETRLWRVTTKTEGWIDRLFISYAGQEVKKGDPLLTIYSPALVSAQSEYLSALRASQSANSLNNLVASARKRLELWDISARQIDELTRTGKVEKYLTLFAPASGVVVTRDILAGQKIAPGDPLMVIADLSVVWADADIYQSDLPNVKPGMPLELTLPYWPDKPLTGKVIFLSPTLDPETRTLKARLEIPNPELLLKPGMYGNARLLYELGSKLTIPASAVMFGGTRTYAFRDNGDGHLVPTEIQIGVRSGDSYELISGLNEGDQVVISANFLVDSESNLKSAMEAMAAPVPGGHQHGAAPASPSKPIQAEDLPADRYAPTLAAYLQIQDALSADDLAKARDAASKLPAIPSATRIASAQSLAEARGAFQTLSATLLAAAEKYGAPEGQPLVHKSCPMAFDGKSADWLQPAGETKNPYFGKEMLGCGEDKGTIAPHSHH